MLRRTSLATIATLVTAVGSIPADHGVAYAADNEVVAGVVTNRVAGASRYGTSSLLARRVCGAYATGYLQTAVAGPIGLTVYVASGSGFADGLAVSGNLGLAGPLLRYPNRSDAALTGQLAGPGPLVLTEPSRLRPETFEALDLLSTNCGINRIVLLGGTSAISTSVESTLRARYGTVQRLGGRDRYATAVALAAALALERIRPEIREVLGPLDAAILTTGRSFADAVAAGVIATRQRIPILLNDGVALRGDVAAYLLDNSIRQVTIVGGTVAVPASVEADLRTLGINVIRVAGRTRFDTAAQLATLAFPAPSEVVLTSGFEFADALSATPFAAIHAAPVLLTRPDQLPAPVTTYLTERATPSGRLWIIGGTSAVSDAAATTAASALTP